MPPHTTANIYSIQLWQCTCLHPQCKFTSNFAHRFKEVGIHYTTSNITFPRQSYTHEFIFCSSCKSRILGVLWDIKLTFQPDKLSNVRQAALQSSEYKRKYKFASSAFCTSEDTIMFKRNMLSWQQGNNYGINFSAHHQIRKNPHCFIRIRSWPWVYWNDTEPWSEKHKHKFGGSN
jgi:hypothetical protein